MPGVRWGSALHDQPIVSPVTSPVIGASLQLSSEQGGGQQGGDLHAAGARFGNPGDAPSGLLVVSEEDWFCFFAPAGAEPSPSRTRGDFDGGPQRASESPPDQMVTRRPCAAERLHGHGRGGAWSHLVERCLGGASPRGARVGSCRESGDAGSVPGVAGRERSRCIRSKRRRFPAPRRQSRAPGPRCRSPAPGFGGHSPIASGGQSGHPSPVASRGGGGIRDEELFKATKDFGGLGAPRTPLAQSRTTLCLARASHAISRQPGPAPTPQLSRLTKSPAAATWAPPSLPAPDPCLPHGAPRPRSSSCARPPRLPRLHPG